MQKIYCWETPKTLQAAQDVKLPTSVTSTPHLSNHVEPAKAFSKHCNYQEGCKVANVTFHFQR